MSPSEKRPPGDAKCLALRVIEKGMAHDADSLSRTLGVMPQRARSLIRDLEASGALHGCERLRRPAPGRRRP
jgi:predicted ArsR family transcriptional regulator